MRTLTDAVERGLGASINLWIPMDTERYRPGIICRPIVNPDIWLDISLCRSKVNQPSPPAMIVEEVMAKVALDRVSHADWPGAKWYNGK
jgi:hypothetical protein